MESKAATERPFDQWRLFTPLPRDAKEVAEAIRKIIEEREWILITISRVKAAPEAKARPPRRKKQLT